MAMEHLSDGDLERYVTGLVHHEKEVRWIEDHLFQCPDCAERMWAMQEEGDGSLETGTPGLYRQNRPVQ